MKKSSAEGSQLCFSCGGAFEPSDGPTHAYMHSTPSCWTAFGQVIAREYQDPPLFKAVHRFTVDAYALQHPGELTDRRALQSVWVHYAALYSIFELNRSFAEAKAAMERMSSRTLAPIKRRPEKFEITVQHVLDAPASDHEERTRCWARSTFRAWRHLAGPAQELLAELP